MTEFINLTKEEKRAAFAYYCGILSEDALKEFAQCIKDNLGISSDVINNWRYGKSEISAAVCVALHAMGYYIFNNNTDLYIIANNFKDKICLIYDNKEHTVLIKKGNSVVWELMPTLDFMKKITAKVN